MPGSRAASVVMDVTRRLTSDVERDGRGATVARHSDFVRERGGTLLLSNVDAKGSSRLTSCRDALVSVVADPPG